MRNLLFIFLSALLFFCSREAPEKHLEIKDKKMVSNVPPFAMAVPSDFQLMDYSSVTYPEKSSLTRVYLFVNEKEKNLEHLLIVQIADKTDPRADPMLLPPLVPDSKERVYEKGDLKERVPGGYLIQLIIWNPESASLQPVIKQGVGIPSHLALQGQLLFNYEGEHAVFIKYSRDVHSFGMSVSEKRDDWNRESLSGNEKKALELFQGDFKGMINSLAVKKP